MQYYAKLNILDLEYVIVFRQVAIAWPLYTRHLSKFQCLAKKIYFKKMKCIVI